MIAQEHRDDRRRCLTAAQTMVVSCTGGGHAQQISIQIDAAQKCTQYQQELQVIFRVFSWFEQIFSGVGAQRIVVVLARAVDVCKRLFMQQAGQIVLFADGAHGFHNQLVVVAGDIGCGIFRRQLVLCRRSFVVLCFAGNSHLPQVLVQILHKFAHTDADTSAVVVIQLLSLGRLCSKEGSTADFQVQALIVQVVVDQEVFLLSTHHRRDLADGVIAQCAQKTHTFAGNCLHRTQQRCFGIQCFAVIGTECCRNKQSAVADKGRRGRVPGGVASCLKSCTQTAGWEGGRVCLAADQSLAGKFQRDASIAIGGG